jgi:proteasome activator subunit 4
MSFLEYMFHKRDPRRYQALVDYLVQEFCATDYNGESSLNAVKALCFFRAFYEEQNWKFSGWMDLAVDRVWAEISSEHDEVRAYISELLAFATKIKWQPKLSVPSAEIFVRECRTVPIDFDILGMRGIYHRTRVQELVQRFPEWRAERLPGARAFQSTYDKVGTTLCRWLFQTVHDTNAISAFDYILPLMPELFRFTEVNDNDELLSRARMLLVRMCGVTPPRPLIGPILTAIFDTILKSPSWKVRVQALPLVQVFYFRQVPLLSDGRITDILEMLCKCLDDEVVEVREMAATTLSGVLRLSPRRSQLTLKDRFIKLLRSSPLPNRQSPVYNAAIRQRHAAILGICALVDSYPYTVERWMPELLANILAEHAYDPIPISLTVQKCASNFKKTHQDTWHEDSKRFTEDQLAALSTLLTGSSYYA